MIILTLIIVVLHTILSGRYNLPGTSNTILSGRYNLPGTSNLIILSLELHNVYFVFLFVGLVLHIMFSIPTISLEIIGTQGSLMLLYGLLYLLSFTFVAFSTNSVVAMIAQSTIGPLGF